MSIYRGYDIVKSKDHFNIALSNSLGGLAVIHKGLKTEEEAMNKIDNIERERVVNDNANIQRIDNQIKRKKRIKSKSLFLNELERVFKR
jgi:hypothetical protein